MAESNAAVPAAIKSKLRRRFYEAIVFLFALTTTWESNRRPVCYESVLPKDDFESDFKTFVNTLSQFCDVKPGGDSVTAFCVVDLHERLQYRFACNRVNSSGLERVKAFVIDLLTTLREDAASADGGEQVLFEKVLDHVRQRVCCYLNAFRSACDLCIATNPADTRLSDQLRLFQQAGPQGDFRGQDSQTFARNCRQLIDLIEQSHRMPEGSVLAERSSHSRLSQSSSCWTELRHHAGRLKSYSVGVRNLMATVRKAPQLLEPDFEVTHVRSSDPDQNPIAAKNVTAEEILGRICSNAAEKLSCIALLEENRSRNINETIKGIVTDETFRPIVHAELLVLQSLLKEGLDRPTNFFNGCKYIGSSKPTCRLCHYYFQAHNGGFQARRAHGNLYKNWKPPDVFQRDGEAAIKARENMMNTMVVKIRDDGLRTLRERVPLGREHDSSTGMTFPPGDILGPLAEHLDREADIEEFEWDSEGGVTLD